MEKHRNDCSGLVVGIDATNLRQGGGVTHLVELLRVAEPARHSVVKIVVWGDGKTLDALEDRSWLEKVNPPELDQGLMKRTLWQWRNLSLVAAEARCSPGLWV